MIWDSTNKHPTSERGPQTRSFGAKKSLSDAHHAAGGKPRVFVPPAKPLRVAMAMPPARLLPGVRPSSGAATSEAANGSQYPRPTVLPRRAAPDDGLTARSHYLKSDRELLRAMRAAEMAAWDAARPATFEPHALAEPKRTPRLPTPDRRGTSVEAWLFVVLAAGAAAATWFGVGDISKLLTGWTKFVDGIRNLIL